MDENEIVRMFRGDFGIAAEPDDIEVIRDGGVNLAAKVDTLVHGTDVPPGMSLRDAARKSVVACVSDFAAKGVRPRWAVISAVLTEACGDGDLSDISRGLADAAREFGFSVRGGDTNRGAELSISVCLLGVCGRTPGRGGAAEGDAVCVSGPFGLSAAGLQIMTGGADCGMDGAVEAVVRPSPRLEFGVSCARHFTSSMDSSDGLSTTLNRMAEQSGVMMEITDAPAADGIYEFAERAGLDADRLVYDGGEEYEIVFTASPSRMPAIAGIAERTGTPLAVIGRVGAGRGVRANGGALRDGGWRAF